MRFIEALDSLIENYNSIDIRVVAYYKEEIWQSILTILRFRLEDVEQIKRQHEKLKDYNLIWNDNFRVGLYALPIKEWPKIQNEFGRGTLVLQSDFGVNIPNEDFNHDVSESPTFLWLDEWNKEWFSYGYKSNPLSTIDQRILNDQSKLSRDSGFGNIFEHLSAILEVKSSDISWYNPTNILVAPVFFKIHDATFIDQIINIQGKWCPNPDIKLNMIVYNREPNGQQGKLKNKMPLNIAYNEGSSIQDFEISKKVDLEPSNEPFDVMATSKGLFLQRYGGTRKSNLSSKITKQNSVMDIFKKFITTDELKKMLVDFVVRGKKDKALVFERGVSWLLSLLGFNPIWLGKEYGKQKEKPEVDIDILASYKNQILLVNVTTGALEPADVTRLIHAKKEFVKEFPNHLILLILFSSLSSKELRSTLGENEVRLIGNQELERILSLIEKDAIEEAQYYLLTPEPTSYGSIFNY